MIIEKIESARDIAAVRRLRAMARAFFFFLPSLPTAKSAVAMTTGKSLEKPGFPLQSGSIRHFVLIIVALIKKKS